MSDAIWWDGKLAGLWAVVLWVGFHTFRHTCATILFRRELNAKQVQMWLGHHSPAFTLATYVHLLPDDLPDPGFLDVLTRIATAPNSSSEDDHPVVRNDWGSSSRNDWGSRHARRGGRQHGGGKHVRSRVRLSRACWTCGD